MTLNYFCKHRQNKSRRLHHSTQAVKGRYIDEDRSVLENCPNTVSIYLKKLLAKLFFVQRGGLGEQTLSALERGVSSILRNEFF